LGEGGDCEQAENYCIFSFGGNIINWCLSINFQQSRDLTGVSNFVIGRDLQRWQDGSYKNAS